MIMGMGASDTHRLVLLRHGETQWTATQQHTGRTDLPLTPHGEKQARAAAPLLTGLALHDPLVLSSPRQRALRTAELAGLPTPQADSDLHEWDYGDYEGLTTDQIHQNVPTWSVFDDGAPGGELPAQVRVRADRVLAKVLPQLNTRDVVLAGHGHFSRVLVARWLELPVAEGRRFVLDTGAISVLGHEHEMRALVAHNLIAAMV